MTITAKPLTADEIGATKQASTWGAEMWPFAPKPIAEIIPRFIATIEQRDEHIKNLRDALMPVFGPGRLVAYDRKHNQIRIAYMDFQAICEALALIEPSK